MKVSAPKSNPNNNSKQKPLLPLVSEINLEELSKENSASFSLHVDPTDNGTPTCKVTIRILQGNEDLNAHLRWVRTQRQITDGLDLNNATSRVNIVESMMRGTPVTLFRAKLRELTETAFQAALDAAADDADRATVNNNGRDHYLSNAIVDESIAHLTSNLAPKKSLQRVKRHLRRECRKPADMKVRTYYQHLARINLEDIPLLPPGGNAQRLAVDELQDIVLYGCPRSWQREMDRQGFDPLDHTLAEVVDFLEQIETSEDFDASATKQEGKKSGKKNASQNNQKKSGDKKFCSFHGWGNHTSEECYKLQGDAKRQKTAGKGKYSNKTRNRKGGDDVSQSQKELAHFVKQAVAAGIKEGTKSEKKRKVKDDLDLNAFEAELKDFNYSEMDDLKIDSDDEFSV